MNILSFTNCPLDLKLGSGKAVIKYSQGLQSVGHSVDVVEPKEYEPWVKFRRATKFRQAWGAWNFAQKTLQPEQLDLVEFYGDEFWLTTSHLSKLAKRPLLVAHTNGLELLATIRERSDNPYSNYLYNLFAKQTHDRFSRKAFSCSDAFVAICEADRRHVLELGLYPVHRTTVVPHGLDQEYLSLPFIPNKQKRVAFTGTWISRKGVKNIITVMSKLLIENTDLHFDIYGTGGLKDTVLSSFPVNLHDRIHVYPYLSDEEIANGLSKCAVFFFPSQYEGFGFALAEAMACSCAVVTTPTGFGAELHHEQEGMICNFNDTEAMELSIKKLLEDDDLRIKIAQQGWQKVRSLTWKSSIKKLSETYEEWVKEHQKLHY
ncbi:glycosyltransferase family 4 protein [Anabaena sp. UHCC 0253]|uniref:glycosyltransferase family 4 protein n=1 Tax=Anabaena sp. UHCC 0253 TaxID=2590019 RepID=UPI001445B5AD|nr:glycosyltransferase family 4 protein [Anabaena sp. UHCC 0253]MTJ53682.1 glycosyltransferase family 4 protein [Anabaena sp. UHCC 0253]